MDGLRNGKTFTVISQRSVEGESGGVPIQTTEAWMERLSEMCRGYKLEDIWNMDESGYFFLHCQIDVFRKRCFHCQYNWWEGNRANCYLEK